MRLLFSIFASVFLAAGAAQAQPSQRTDSALADATDTVILDLHQAYRKGDRRRVATLLPQARGHLLEPWAAYWDLRLRLDDAKPSEVREFLQRFAGSYQEDRLRNDWLLLLGARREWAAFLDEHPRFRMNDDRDVRCYAVASLIESSQSVPDAAVNDVRQTWFAQRDVDDACLLAATRLLADKRLTPGDFWQKARLATEANRPRLARTVIERVAPELAAQVTELHDNPMRFLSRRTSGQRPAGAIVALALGRAAANDPEAAAEALEQRWQRLLTPEERNWVWGAIGKAWAMRLDAQAARAFSKVSRGADLSDDMQLWRVRAFLRASDWKAVAGSIDEMPPNLRNDVAWEFWRARAQLSLARTDEQKAEATAALARVAGPRGFYEQMAAEALGQRIQLPPPPPPLTTDERERAQGNIGLRRALHAIRIGLRPEGVREWNYTVNLHQPGGMNERDLLAAADFACRHEVWDRCINTSERTREAFDVQQRYPMPFREAVVQRAQAIGLDPAYVYGLIRQESRFILDARSHVGASGLMQVMPATAKWTARKIGLNDFTPSQIADRDTNIAIGTGYLKLVLDDFQGSQALAAAAYNAGPSRPRAWRNGPVLDAAIWAENIPFNETRDYVKKVLANATIYAAILSGQAQSLRLRLGLVGPRDGGAPDVNRDLP